MVEYIVAIDVTRVRFPADAAKYAPLAWYVLVQKCCPQSRNKLVVAMAS